MHECRDVNTTGHTSGGAIVVGLDRFRFVGDAIFVGSMGGPNVLR